MALRAKRVNHVGNIASKIGDVVLELITSVPDSDEIESTTPRAQARTIRRIASAKALAAAGALALPVGPLGWLTILPELGAVWRIQSQMVADIAAAYGKSATLTKEQVTYCLFRHTAAQALREVVVQVGERFLVHQASVRAFQAVARQVGIRMSQRSLSRVVSRWVPILGAAGVGAYAYYDTSRIARTAIEFFGSDIEVVAFTPTTEVPAKKVARKIAPKKLIPEPPAARKPRTRKTAS